MASPTARQLGPVIFITLGVCMILAGLRESGSLNRLEHIIHDHQSSLARSNSVLPPSVSVILIDEPALQYMDPVVGRWPWPREVYREIIQYINLGQPKAILFDILFSERQGANGASVSNSSNGDAQLINASTAAGNVVHGMQLLQDDSVEATPVPLPNAVLSHAYQFTQLLPAGSPLAREQLEQQRFNDHLSPFPRLSEAAWGIGVVNAINDVDGVYRRAQPLFSYQGQLLPALSIAGLVKDLEGRQLLNNSLQSGWAFEKTGRTVAVNFYKDNRAYSMSGIFQSITQFQQGDMETLLIPPDTFKDQYVFIGASAIGLHDLKQLPVLNLAPGVFVHADLLGNLLSNDRLLVAADVIEYTSILFFALCSVMSVLRTRRLFFQIAVPAALLLLYYFAALFARYHNWQFALTGPMLGILLSWISAYTYLFATEEKEKKQIRAMFSRYVSPAALSLMVDRAEEFKNAASGNRQTVTILFSDMRGFTSLSEQVSAEELIRILNHYFSAMTQIVFDHGGTIDKFIGDAIMATWGAPLNSNTHALDAVNAALAMQDALPNINQWLTKQDLPEIAIGIGIHTGQAIMGSIGSAQKADFTVIGDSVNLASRLEGVTKLYRRAIVISASTEHAICAEHVCQLLDCVQVKGKHQATKLFSPLRYGAGREIANKSDAQDIARLSLRAFALYSQGEWQTCLDILRELPDAAQLHKLKEHCQDCLNMPPGADWNPVTQLHSK